MTPDIRTWTTHVTPTTLRRFRQRRGWTQAEAADWYGCSTRSWQRYESGSRRIPRPLALQIVALAVSRSDV